MLVDLKERTGKTLEPQILRQLVEQALLERDLIKAADITDPNDGNNTDEVTLYENNKIFKALLDMEQKADEGERDEMVEITKAIGKSQAQYLHAQLDEAALYYRSKHSKLIDALNKADR